MLADALACSVVGAPETVRRGLEAFVASTTADELMVTAQIFDHDARKQSFGILARVNREIADPGEWDDRRLVEAGRILLRPGREARRLDWMGVLAVRNSPR